jgi:hypothetical protein
LAQEGLIDEYQIVVCPIVLGQGRTLFEGVKENLPLKLIKSRTFKNGDVLLCYEPKGEGEERRRLQSHQYRTPDPLSSKESDHIVHFRHFIT